MRVVNRFIRATQYATFLRVYLRGETMAYQALYRKYRPQSFSDVIGQEHITVTLQNELKEGKIVHAYLFTGTRGTGKTTCAKILAKAINCTAPVSGDPCCECDMCRAVANDEITDIVEIDAASNNGVDDIRELREQVAFTPASAKYRVYIIDEVHMLSQSAFNALLKTLEEPPEHVVFILATTEVHKLPATILSRCQRFDFRRIDSEKICARLQSVAEREGLTLDDDAGVLIASAADGGMRDALSILDLCASSSNHITEKTVASVCSMASNDYLVNMAEHIKNGNSDAALTLVDELHNSSVDMLRLLTELTNHYRDLMIIKAVKSKNRPIVCSAARLHDLEAQAASYDIKEIMCILGVLQSAFAAMQTGNRRCEMEMAIIRLCHPEARQDLGSLEMRIAALEKGAVKASEPTKIAPIAPVENKADIKPPVVPIEEPFEEEPPLPEPPVEETYDEAPSSEVIPPAPVAEGSVERWDEVLQILRKTCPIIAGVLQGSNAYISGDRLLIDTQNSQFRSLFNGGNPLYRNSIRKAAEQVLGQTYKLGPYRKPAVDTSEDPLAAFAQKLKELEEN